MFTIVGNILADNPQECESFTSSGPVFICKHDERITRIAGFSIPVFSSPGSMFRPETWFREITPLIIKGSGMVLARANSFDGNLTISYSNDLSGKMNLSEGIRL